MKKYAIPVAIVLFVILLVRWSAQKAVVTNESGQSVRSLTLKVTGKTVLCENLAPGDSASIRFHVRDEDNLYLEGSLADGTDIEEGGFYFVWEEVGKTSDFVILPGGKVERRPSETSSFVIVASLGVAAL